MPPRRNKRMRSRRPKLYEDVLLAIMDVCAPATIARLMRTCRMLYRAGPKRLLATNPYIGDTVSSDGSDCLLRSFCLFLMAERCSRFRYLPQLHVGVTWIAHREVANMFHECVLRMSHLEVLSFVADLDALLDCHPGLVDAFARLPRLKHLSISTRGKACFPMLKKMRSRLVSVSLRLWRDKDDDDLDPLPDMNPVTLLIHSKDTLQRLNCETWDAFRVFPRNPQYLAMRHLTIDCEVLPATKTLVRAYPNLTHLHINWTDLDSLTAMPEYLEGLERKHLENVQAQDRAGRWSALEEVEGSLEGIYAMGLTCKVERLLPRGVTQEADLIMLDRVVNMMCPTHLQLWTLAEYFGEGPCDIPSILRKAASVRLKSLDVDLDFHHDAHPDAPVAHYLAFLLETLRSLPALETVEIKISASRFITYSKDNSTKVFPNGTAGMYLRDFPLKAFADALLNMNPTLRSISLKLVGVRNPKGNGVTITRACGDIDAERIVSVSRIWEY
ncbi:hypothetical protein C8Q70DRAFT_1014848 [Cubamyces menziesii]|nr:hypothetical protein C8Q70DRAFT_1014848 [Cubamyces menziesii]